MLYEFAIELIGELPTEFQFIYAIFILLFVIALVGVCLFPFVFIHKIFE